MMMAAMTRSQSCGVARSGGVRGGVHGLHGAVKVQARHLVRDGGVIPSSFKSATLMGANRFESLNFLDQTYQANLVLSGMMRLGIW
jgi:hypothetical protein